MSMEIKESIKLVRDTVFIIETVESSTSVVKHGGGVCIDSGGILVTVAHIIPPVSGDIIVRRRSEIGFVNADVLNVNYVFDIAFLKIRNESENEGFSHVSFGKNIHLDEQAQLFSWLHHNVGFSLVTGKISYPYRSDDVTFPSVMSTSTIGANLLRLEEKREDAFRRTLPFRTTGGITRSIDDDLHDLHPDLPLIEVHGFFGKSGSSGSPVFSSTDGTFIGLIMLYHSEKNYILPVDFISHYMDEHKISADALKIT